MTLHSMTGFASASGANAPWRWSIELKSVNAKGLDLRLRLPTGFDALESELRKRLGQALSRGAVYATITAQREGLASAPQINQAALASVMRDAIAAAKQFGLAPPSIDGLLGVRGIVEIAEAPDEEAVMARVRAGVVTSFEEATRGLLAMRRTEGDALCAILLDKMASIEALVKAADANPAREPEAVRARLKQSISAILESGRGFDENRLAQEAVLLAAKADIREELDRLYTHIGAARDLLRGGGPVGRKLDFLAQELGREANTLCAKANDVSLTAIGLDLRARIEQVREQVQNVE